MTQIGRPIKELEVPAPVELPAKVPAAPKPQPVKV